MKDLIDLKALWMWMIEKWRTSFIVVFALVLGFVSGSLTAEKSITEDCRFMGSFRDGAQAYNCQPRVR